MKKSLQTQQSRMKKRNPLSLKNQQNLVERMREELNRLPQNSEPFKSS
jgi:hypothetical protein